jgi:hypothetical protein
MRRFQQKQILELLETVKKAQEAGLFADCQECALVIGEFIEDIHGEGTKTVSLLEEYCDLVYKASNGEIGEKPLRKQIIQIENSIKNELKPTRIEMVFLSYKASMSDSLESIYQAAKTDPNCDAYWIPIPYYDRNPDGSFGTMHYEGADYYPPDRECTDWREYDIEERQPDVIFTFNPYDEFGYMTSVHPDFYCLRLRELTGFLVYVPYFVTEKAGGNFVKSAGVMFPHLVVVQSEDIRQDYIRGHKELEKEGFNREIYGGPEKKIVALGSPKIDAVVNAKPEDFVIPDEWRKLINNPDGTVKSTVFYNTSISAVLNNEQYLKKLKFVLESFRRRDDIVLWWRPHPLMRTAFTGMRPELLLEYDQIVAEYKKDARGIYDDTPDLHRAIACTNIYYGDWSSVALMYGVTGKPIVLQDINKIDSKVLLCFPYFDIDNEGRYWGFDCVRDGLFELDFISNTARLATKSRCIPKLLGKKYFRSTHRYIMIQCVGDEIYCFPFYLDNILVYNKINDSTRLIHLDRNYLLSPESDGFAVWSVVVYNKKIYCFGMFTKAIVVIDTVNHSVQYDTSLFEHIGFLTENREYSKHPVYMSDCSEDGTVTLIMSNCEHLIRYSLPTGEFEYIKSNPLLAQCVLSIRDGDDIWLLSEKSDKLIKWQPDTNKSAVFSLLEDGFDFTAVFYAFSSIADYGDYILLFPGLGKLIIKFCKKTGQFIEYNEMPVPTDIENKIYKYDRSKSIDDSIYAFSRHNHTIYQLNLLSNEIKELQFVVPEQSYALFYNDFLTSIYNEDYADSTRGTFADSTLGDIASFFAAVLPENRTVIPELRDYYSGFLGNTSGTAGKAIYDYITQLVL